MKILLTSNSFYNTPGEHYNTLFSNDSISVDYLSGPLDEDALLNIIAEYDGILCGDDTYSERVLLKGAQGNLKVLSKYGIGLDKINVDKALELGISVYNTPGVNHQSVAEHVLALLLSYEKNISTHYFNTTSNKWIRLAGREIFDKNVLIFGFGRIGKEVAKRLQSFGMHISFYDPFFDGIVPQGVIRLLDTKNIKNGRFSYLSLHLPLTRATDKIIDVNVLNQLNSDAVIINTSRAGCIDPNALKRCLHEGTIRAYLTDVINDEPMKENHEWNNVENVYITPHVGSRNLETVERQGMAAIANLFQHLKIK